MQMKERQEKRREKSRQGGCREMASVLSHVGVRSGSSTCTSRYFTVLHSAMHCLCWAG